MTPVGVLLMVRELGIGGCERDLTKIALGLDRTRWMPHVGCFHPEGMRSAELRQAGVPIVKFPVRSFASWSAVGGGLALRRYIKEHSICVVHPFDVPTDLFAVPVARLCRVPAVISAQLSFRYMYDPIYRVLMKGIDRLAHRIIVNSEAVRQDLIATEGVAATKLYVCHNGVDTREFYPSEKSNSRSLVVGSVCALREEKRLDLLINAFARIRQIDSQAELRIVGSGEKLSELQTLAVRLGLCGVCKFEPAKACVADSMREMDIFVIPSRSESFPNALLEAMACGCCVIGSRVGGIPELIKDGESGLLFSPEDLEDLTGRLTAVATNPTLRQRLAKAAVCRAHQEFSLKQVVACTESLYYQLLGKASFRSKEGLGESRGI